MLDEKESLEEDYKLQREKVDRIRKAWVIETDPADKFKYEQQLQEEKRILNELGEQLDVIERQYRNYQKKSKLDGIINILQGYFDKEKAAIFNAYEASLYQVRKLNKINPQNIAEIVNELDLPTQGNYSYIDKFVGYLYLNNTELSLSEDFQGWRQKHIQEWHELIQQLLQEQQQRQQQSHPCLMMAISASGDNYVVEAWLIKNLLAYNRESFSDCEQLKIDNQLEISTDKNLTNLPKIIINLIQQSLIKADKNIKQIHLFLPSELMNHDFDAWKSEEFEEDEEDFATGICEDYEVVIRCSDRLRGKSPPVFKWREKGNRFKDKLEHYANGVFVLGSSDHQKTLFDQIKQEHIIAVKITSIFEKRDVLGKIIFKSALPLALWTRQPIPDIEGEFQRILTPENNDISLKKLPSQFKNQKSQGSNHITHLCLLWDNPDLLPPEQLLSQKQL
ncbi:hypothetical protein ACQFX9_17250 [Aliinostoc sp. HNIBRCY26]|uniref:VMAP-C domain-containing protein n=1 Tax=Aliinostoc sp. HNIBRCY26 TaxID=3418997 RepID=UPI003D029AAB